MGYMEKILAEIQLLSPEQQNLVLNYVAALKSRKTQSLMSSMSKEQLSKRDELMNFFAKFNADLSNYRFDRDEANDRR